MDLVSAISTSPEDAEKSGTGDCCAEDAYDKFPEPEAGIGITFTFGLLL